MMYDCRAFQSWGSVLLGLGLCVMLACLILCIHTYFVMSRLDSGADQELEDIDKVDAIAFTLLSTIQLACYIFIVEVRFFRRSVYLSENGACRKIFNEIHNVRSQIQQTTRSKPLDL